jgi:cystathionine beta-lyase
MSRDQRSGEAAHSPRQGTDAATLRRHFGTADPLVPLWIAEPSIGLAPEVNEALRARVATGWYGYETRPESVIETFWGWMLARHSWDGSQLRTSVSPSVGTSIGVLIDQLTSPGEGVIIQPPVFTDFKTLIASSGRCPVRNSLVLTDGGYRIDFDGLAALASEPANRMLILCSPHNPVGRVWTREELARVASICAEHDVFVLADEIHADLAIAPHEYVPFAAAALQAGTAWASTHGPIKTFGLAGVCDTLLITDHDEVADLFDAQSTRLHLTRNNVFGLAAFEAAYSRGGPWLDDFLGLIDRNIALLHRLLPRDIGLRGPEGTYLAWLDLRSLGLEVTEIPTWLASSAGVALSPGHWFGREGAGFARMTIAASSDTIEQAAEQLATAVSKRQNRSSRPTQRDPLDTARTERDGRCL